MLRVKTMDNCDKFWDNEYVCWVTVDGVGDKFIREAKEIDGEFYSSDCFGIWVGKDNEGWFIGQDSPGCELFYIDNDGEKHWMSYILSDEEEELAIKFCKEYIGEE